MAKYYLGTKGTNVVTGKTRTGLKILLVILGIYWIWLRNKNKKDFA